MKRSRSTAVSTVTTAAGRSARLKGHLAHLLLAQREIKFAVSRPRFLLATRARYIAIMIYSFAVTMINYESQFHNYLERRSRPRHLARILDHRSPADGNCVKYNMGVISSGVIQLAKQCTDGNKRVSAGGIYGETAGHPQTTIIAVCQQTTRIGKRKISSNRLAA